MGAGRQVAVAAAADGYRALRRRVEAQEIIRMVVVFSAPLRIRCRSTSGNP
jgi:hypothetical protein